MLYPKKIRTGPTLYNSVGHRRVNLYSHAKTAGKQIIKRLSSTNYQLAQAYYQFALGRRARHRTYRHDPILIYQMGKVGSTTIKRSLQALDLDAPIYHIHVLSQEGIDRIEGIYRRTWARGQHPRPLHLWHSQFLRKQILRGMNNKRRKVITLVRDPIARNISSFFEVLDLELEFQYEQKASQMQLDHLVDELIENFWNRFIHHERPLTWFDDELKAVFGIDVFATEFPHSRGFQIFSTDTVDVLLIRLEDLDRCARDAFNSFLGLDTFDLIPDNVGAEKYYAAGYRRFLEKIIFPDSYLETLYNSVYARHFYTPDELAAFETQWRRTGTADINGPQGGRQ